MMPGKNGLEFIKDHKKKLDTPIILLTAKGEANERVEGLETGADDYLPKPFEPKELILRIKNILDKTLKTEQVRIIEFANIKERVSFVGMGETFQMWDPDKYSEFQDETFKQSQESLANLKWNND